MMFSLKKQRLSPSPGINVFTATDVYPKDKDKPIKITVAVTDTEVLGGDKKPTYPSGDYNSYRTQLRWAAKRKIQQHFCPRDQPSFLCGG